MKTAFFIEDSPEGLVTKFVWQGNGCQDNPADSIAMHVQANFVSLFAEMDQKRLVRLVKGAGDTPSSPTKAF